MQSPIWFETLLKTTNKTQIYLKNAFLFIFLLNKISIEKKLFFVKVNLWFEVGFFKLLKVWQKLRNEVQLRQMTLKRY